MQSVYKIEIKDTHNAWDILGDNSVERIAQMNVDHAAKIERDEVKRRVEVERVEAKKQEELERVDAACRLKIRHTKMMKTFNIQMFKRRSHRMEDDFHDVVCKYFKKRGHRILDDGRKGGGGADIISKRKGIMYITELKNDVDTHTMYIVVGQIIIRQHKNQEEGIKARYQIGFPYEYKRSFSKNLITFLLKHQIQIIFIY